MNRFVKHLMSAPALMLAVGISLTPGHAYDAQSKAAVNIDAGSIAIRGYDPVAYFTDGKPVEGAATFKAVHNGATYQFANAANRDAFMKDPAKFEPQYGGFCAYAAALGKKADIDPTAFKIVDGKLYLNFNAAVNTKWSADLPGFIGKANASWSSIKDKAPTDLK
jgi:YHS domain-containing protein